MSKYIKFLNTLDDHFAATRKNHPDGEHMSAADFVDAVEKKMRPSNVEFLRGFIKVALTGAMDRPYTAVDMLKHLRTTLERRVRDSVAESRRFDGTQEW